jgi:hypothetical protein
LSKNNVEQSTCLDSALCNTDEEVMIIHHHISDVVDCGWNGRLKLAQAVRLGIRLNIGLKLCSTQLCEIIVYRS